MEALIEDGQSCERAAPPTDDCNLTEADEYGPPPTEAERAKFHQQRQQIADALPALVERLKQYACYNPVTFAAVLRHTPAIIADGDMDADTAANAITDRIEHLPKGHLQDGLTRCLDVLCEGAGIVRGLDAMLSGDPGFFGAEYDDDVAAFLALAADLPPPVERVSGYKPEMVDFECVAPERKPFGTMIPGLLDRGAFCIGSGQPNAGKTFFFLDLALSQAAGRPWRGQPTTEGATLIVAAEDAAGLLSRVDAWKLCHGVTEAPVTILDRALDLSTPEGGQALLSYVFELQRRHYRPADMVLIDNLARCLGGADETSGSVMMAVVTNLDRVRSETGAAVVLICHPPRGGTGPRGHGALPAAADTIISVEPGVAKVTKQRAAEVGLRMPFRIVPVAALDGRPAGAVIEHTQDTAPVAAPIAAKADDGLAALIGAVGSAAAAGRPFKLHQTGGLYERRADLPAPLFRMGRNKLVALAQAGIAAGVLINNGGTLTALAKH